MSRTMLPREQQPAVLSLYRPGTRIGLLLPSGFVENVVKLANGAWNTSRGPVSARTIAASMPAADHVSITFPDLP